MSVKYKISPIVARHYLMVIKKEKFETKFPAKFDIYDEDGMKQKILFVDIEEIAKQDENLYERNLIKDLALEVRHEKKELLQGYKLIKDEYIKLIETLKSELEEIKGKEIKLKNR